jgi:hypothetical protein
MPQWGNNALLIIEGSGKSSNFHNDIEAIVAANKIIETTNHFK